MRWGALWEWADQSLAGSLPKFGHAHQAQGTFSKTDRNKSPFYVAVPWEIMGAACRSKGPQDRRIGAGGVFLKPQLYSWWYLKYMLDDSREDVWADYWNTQEPLGNPSWCSGTLGCSTSIWASVVGLTGLFITNIVTTSGSSVSESHNGSVSFWIMDKRGGKETGPPLHFLATYLFSRLFKCVILV